MAAETHSDMEKISMLLRAVEATPAKSEEPDERSEEQLQKATQSAAETEATSGSESAPADLDEAAPQAASETEQAFEKKESYLTAARRAANASVVQKVEKPKRKVAAPKAAGRARVLFAACAAPAVVVAVAGFALNHHSVSAQTTAHPTAPAKVASTAPKFTPTAPVVVPATNPETQTTQDASALPIRSLPDEKPAAQVAAASPANSVSPNSAPAGAKSERELGLKYLAGDGVPANDEEAARLLLRAAYGGEPTAQYWLGTLYERGRGVPADPFQARHWYEAAAKKGNRTAMHNLAVADLDGRGVEKNVEEAVQWFGKAAELGMVDSQFNLAVLYERGSGVTQSLPEAYKWYAIAAAGGDKEAAARVTVLANQLKPEELAKARSAAAAFKPAPLDASANAAGGPAAPPG